MQCRTRVLRELGATAIAIGDKPDGININDNVGSTHPVNLQQAVLDHDAQVGCLRWRWRPYHHGQ